MSMISKRGQRIANNSSILSDVWERLLLDGYHKTDNPQGIINLGTSENKLMYDILKPKFQEPASREIQEHHTQYCDFRGTYEFRKAVAEFLDHYMKPLENIDPDNLCVINGCNAIVEAMGTVLADPGEGFLLPTPYYGGFQIDLKQRAEVVPFPVYLTNKPVRGETGPFQLSVYRLEKAMDEAKKQNIKIRALLLCNPNNPFGYIYSEKLLQDFLEFAQRNSLHVIIDEIYLLSIFKKEYSMKSMLALNNLPDKQYVHVIWGFSKDFGISGFRCGVLHTWNKEVLGALWWISYFQCVPTSTQCLLLNLINDRDWIDNVYMPTNHQRLLECYHIVCDGLFRAGIPYMESYAGLFIWADFREIVPSLSLEEEQMVFKKFLDFKVYIGPGQAFCYNEGGWFRLVFATHPDQLRIGMERVVSCVDAIRKENLYCRNRSMCHDHLTAFNSDKTDEVMADGESFEEQAQGFRLSISNSDWLSLKTTEKRTKEIEKHHHEDVASKTE